VGDGKAETGPLAGSWKGVSFLNPMRDGAVLPILHLNGYKISGPTVFGRSNDADLGAVLEGNGYEVHFVEGDDPALMHQEFATTLDTCNVKIRAIQESARTHGFSDQPRWPAIVLRTPKGWTGPKGVGGLPVEGTFRAHQVPLPDVKADPEQLATLEAWMHAYQPEELFDSNGKLIQELAVLAPSGDSRMGANPHANGGKLLVDLDLPAAMRSTAHDPPSSATNRRVRLAHCCGTSLRGMPGRRTPARSARTRPTRTDGTACSTSRTAASSAGPSKSTIPSSRMVG
jgi:xylulose-5-phosphate/fructose-6-phosphate phosphoketolase